MQSWMAENRLLLSPSKTKLLLLLQPSVLKIEFVGILNTLNILWYTLLWTETASRLRHLQFTLSTHVKSHFCRCVI